MKNLIEQLKSSAASLGEARKMGPFTLASGSGRTGESTSIAVTVEPGGMSMLHLDGMALFTTQKELATWRKGLDGFLDRFSDTLE